MNPISSGARPGLAAAAQRRPATPQVRDPQGEQPQLKPAATDRTRESSGPELHARVSRMQAGAQSTHALFSYGNTAQATRSANTGTIIDTYA